MPETAERILLRGATVVTLDERDTVAKLDIRIEQGRVVALAPSLPARGVDRVIEASGSVAMPGLVQGHLHLCQTLFRGCADDMELLSWLQERIWPLEAAHDADTLRAAARLGLCELLLGGTTTILDMGTVHHTDVLFEEAAAFGMRYTGGKVIMDFGQGFPPTLRESPEAALADSEALCGRWHNSYGGRLRYAFSPRFAVSCSETALRGCAERARAHGALVHTHASENTEEVQMVRARTGMGNVEYLHSLGLTGPDVVLAHGIWMTAQEQRLVRDTNTRIVHCPSSNLKLASGIARIDDLLAAGVHLALGADGAACANALDGFMEMRLAALLHKVRGGPMAVPASAALHMATRGGAVALGLGDCGSIALGQRADILLLDMHRPHLFPKLGDIKSRLVYAAARSDVHTVLVDGQVRVADGALCGVDLEAVLRDADDAAERLLHRAGLIHKV
jgi:5-methylthioadenosine/S-adenosylhomocysteine deaminase